MRTPAKRIALMWLIGSLLLQLAWISALPPFAGVDEFDHAYRASAVAHGQITNGHIAATDGRGELVVVDRSIADAARAQCEARTYTGPDNCRPVADAGPGMVTIASAAASYNPAFYFVVGKAAEPFDGAYALYVMRLVAALLCSLFLALAAWLTCLWARTRWPLVGLMVASTPVLVYSASIASPNGLEMCAALSVWAALLGLSRTDRGAARQRRLLLWATPGAVVVATIRTMGPALLLLIVATCVAVIGARATMGLIRRHLTVILPVSVAVLAATLANMAWIITQAPNTREDTALVPLQDPVLNSLQQVPLWFFQSIAAFPSRTEQAPLAVYLLYMVAFFSVLILGWRSAGRSRRLAVLVAGVFTVALSVGVNSYYYTTDGDVWQGRYGLPYAVGIVLISVLALDEARWSPLRSRSLLRIGWAVLTAAQVVGVTSVALKMIDKGSVVDDPVWVYHSPVMIATLTVLGWSFWALAIKRFVRGRSDELVTARVQEHLRTAVLTH